MRNKRFKFVVFGVLALTLLIVLVGRIAGGNELNGRWHATGLGGNNFEYYSFRGRNFERSIQFDLTVPGREPDISNSTSNGTFSIRNNRIEFTYPNGFVRTYSFSFGNDEDTIYINGRRFQR